MSDIAHALEGLLDANLEEIEKRHARIEALKEHRADVAALITAHMDEQHEKLKALREAMLIGIDMQIAEEEALILRLNGQEPPPPTS